MPACLGCLAPDPGFPRSSHQWTHTYHHLPCPIVGITTTYQRTPFPSASCFPVRREANTNNDQPPPHCRSRQRFCMVYLLSTHLLSVSFISSSRSALRGHFQAHQTRVFPFHLPPLTPSNFTSRHQPNFPNPTTTSDVRHSRPIHENLAHNTLTSNLLTRLLFFIGRGRFASHLSTHLSSLPTSPPILSEGPYPTAEP